jgi:hypothetical protein
MKKKPAAPAILVWPEKVSRDDIRGVRALVAEAERGNPSVQRWFRDRTSYVDWLEMTFETCTGQKPIKLFLDNLRIACRRQARKLRRTAPKRCKVGTKRGA